MMKYAGFDFGTKRIGVAVSDPQGRIAFPKTVFLNDENPRFAEQISAFLKEEKISQIVVGLPLAADGGETEMSQTVRTFAAFLETITLLSIHFENELLTSRIAGAQGAKRGSVDAASAALILQSFLDRLNR